MAEALRFTPGFWYGSFSSHFPQYLRPHVTETEREVAVAAPPSPPSGVQINLDVTNVL